MRMWMAVFLVAGCGGSFGPPDLSGLSDMSAPVAPDLASGSDCTEPTSGFWVVSGLQSIARVSPDPSSWDDGHLTAVVKQDSTPLNINGFVGHGDSLLFWAEGHIYTGDATAIQNKQLVVADAGLITTSAPISGSISHLGGTPSQLSMTYGNGSIGILSGTVLTLTNSPQLPQTCGLADWTGAVSDMHYTLTAVCYGGLEQMNDSTGLTPIGGSKVGLVGIQDGYVMDDRGNLYDANLSLIKATRQCTPSKTDFNHGRPLTVSQL